MVCNSYDEAWQKARKLSETVLHSGVKPFFYLAMLKIAVDIEEKNNRVHLRLACKGMKVKTQGAAPAGYLSEKCLQGVTPRKSFACDGN